MIKRKTPALGRSFVLLTISYPLQALKYNLLLPERSFRAKPLFRQKYQLISRFSKIPHIAFSVKYRPMPPERVGRASRRLPPPRAPTGPLSQREALGSGLATASRFRSPSYARGTTLRRSTLMANEAVHSPGQSKIPIAVGILLCPQRESNSHNQLRSLAFYPLNYRGKGRSLTIQDSAFFAFCLDAYDYFRPVPWNALWTSRSC
jgi:hypothetical protein